MKMKFTFEFVFLKEYKIDPKLKKFQEYLIKASAIKRNLFMVEKDFDPSKAIDEVVASVMNDNVTRFKNYFILMVFLAILMMLLVLELVMLVVLLVKVLNFLWCC